METNILKSSEQEGVVAVTELTVESQNKFSDALKNAVNIVIEKCLSRASYSCFKKSFPEIALEDPIFFKDTHRQLSSQLKENFTEDLEKFFIEQNVDKKLYELNLLIKSEQGDEKVCWRPSGDPNKDIRDHRCKSKLKHLGSLQTILQHHQAKNEELLNTLNENHEEILQIKRKVFDMDTENQAKLKILTENQLSMLEELMSVAEEIQ